MALVAWQQELVLLLSHWTFWDNLTSCSVCVNPGKQKCTQLVIHTCLTLVHPCFYTSLDEERQTQLEL